MTFEEMLKSNPFDNIDYQKLKDIGFVRIKNNKTGQEFKTPFKETFCTLDIEFYYDNVGICIPIQPVLLYKYFAGIK